MHSQVYVNCKKIVNFVNDLLQTTAVIPKVNTTKVHGDGINAS